jgi:Flp pilus assembly protein TadD
VNGDDYNTYTPYLLCMERIGQKKEGAALRKRMTVVLRQQLEVVPEDVRARILLATNLANDGAIDESMRHLQTAVEMRPKDGNTLYNAACTYGILGKRRKRSTRCAKSSPPLRKFELGFPRFGSRLPPR